MEVSKLEDSVGNEKRNKLSFLYVRGVAVLGFLRIESLPSKYNFLSILNVDHNHIPLCH